MHADWTIIDGLQYSAWSREVFEQMREGGLNAVHVTIAYHENTRETLTRLGEWNSRFEAMPDLIRPVMNPEDIHKAKAEGRIGIIFGAQNCSPIEDEIRLIELMRQLGLMIMQLTYNNQSLLACGCYEEEDSGLTRFGKQVVREMNRVGMVIDMSHSAERSTLEAVDHSEQPVIISHANPSHFHPALRNKSNRVIDAIAANEGLLGFSLYPFHLKKRPRLHPRGFLRHGGVDGGANGGGSYWFWVRSVSKPTAIGAGVDAQWPLVENHGLRGGVLGQRGLARRTQLV